MHFSSQHRRKLIPLVAGLLLFGAAGFVVSTQGGANASDDVPLARTYDFPNGENSKTFQGPVERPDCGLGSKPETGLQGQVTIADRESGRSSAGYTCNMELVGHYGVKDGFEGAEWQLARYKDQSGRQDRKSTRLN